LPSPLTIRKAFEVVLAAAIEAEYGSGFADPTDDNCMVWWPNQKFDPKDKPMYVRPSFQGYEEEPRTLGPNPAVSREGFYKVGCFLQAGAREDPLDTLAETVKAAYPYNTDLTAGGASVQIERIRVGELINPPAWAYKPVDIYWRVHI
jgi:hypothetical protein